MSNETLAVIRKIVEDREPGSDYLFEFKDVGLAERDPSEAIQVYRWVEGEDLSSQQGGLSAECEPMGPQPHRFHCRQRRRDQILPHRRRGNWP